MTTPVPNSISCYVQDCTGTRYLMTMAGLDYEAAFRKHARWWLRYIQTESGRKAYKGQEHRLPAFPCTIHVEPYFDKTSEPKPRKRRKAA